MFLVSDRAKASLAANIHPTDTQIQLASGTGPLFPTPQNNPDDNGLSGYFALTLVSAGSGIYEICHCTKRDGDLLTVIRGCEGTSPNGFITGDLASLNDTAARIRGASQYGHLGNFNPAAIHNESITGYEIGALLVDPSGLFFWQNLKDQNTTAPGSDNTWLKVDFQAMLKSIQGGGYPIGASLIWNSVDNPAQGIWLEEDGSQYDTTKYPLLYSVLKSDHLPNSSGRFIRCSNNNGGRINPDNTSLNGTQESALNASDITVQDNAEGSFSATRPNWGGNQANGCFSESGLSGDTWSNNARDKRHYTNRWVTLNLAESIHFNGGNETRPSAITKRFLIRAA